MCRNSLRRRSSSQSWRAESHQVLTFELAGQPSWICIAPHPFLLRNPDCESEYWHELQAQELGQDHDPTTSGKRMCWRYVLEDGPDSSPSSLLWPGRNTVNSDNLHLDGEHTNLFRLFVDNHFMIASLDETATDMFQLFTRLHKKVSATRRKHYRDPFTRVSRPNVKSGIPWTTMDG